jgi:hypothetical protein
LTVRRTPSVFSAVCSQAILASDRIELIPPIGTGRTVPWARRSPMLIDVHLAQRRQAGEVRATIMAGRGATSGRGSVLGVALSLAQQGR